MIFSLCAGCASVPKLISKGRTGRAYQIAFNRISRPVGKGKRPGEKNASDYVLAYRTVQEEDYAAVHRLQRREDPAKHAALYRHYSRLYARSLDLLEVLPDSARFDDLTALSPATLEQRREESRKRAGQHYLDRIGDLRPEALLGDKTAARAAFFLYDTALHYLPERTADLFAEQRRMKDLGVLNILLIGQYGEPVFTTALQTSEDAHRGWTSVYTRTTPDRVDMEAEVVYQHYKRSGPETSCSTESYSEEVLDYVEERKSRVKVNDTTWVIQVEKIEHYKTVYAEVTTCEQHAMVCAIGVVSVYAPGEERPRFTAPITGVERWSHTYGDWSGDLCALPGGYPSGSEATPPSFDVMLRKAKAELPELAKRALLKQYAPEKVPDRYLARPIQ